MIKDKITHGIPSQRSLLMVNRVIDKEEPDTWKFADDELVKYKLETYL